MIYISFFLFDYSYYYFYETIRSYSPIIEELTRLLLWNECNNSLVCLGEARNIIYLCRKNGMTANINFSLLDGYRKPKIVNSEKS